MNCACDQNKAIEYFEDFVIYSKKIKIFSFLKSGITSIFRQNNETLRNKVNFYDSLVKYKSMK